MNVATEFLHSVLLANPSLRIYYKRIDINSGPLQDAVLEITSDHVLDDASLSIYLKYTGTIDENLNHTTLKVDNFQILTVDHSKAQVFAKPAYFECHYGRCKVD